MSPLKVNSGQELQMGFVRKKRKLEKVLELIKRIKEVQGGKSSTKKDAE